MRYALSFLALLTATTVASPNPARLTERAVCDPDSLLGCFPEGFVPFNALICAVVSGLSVRLTAFWLYIYPTLFMDPFFHNLFGCEPFPRIQILLWYHEKGETSTIPS